MRFITFITIIIFALASRLVALATANPLPNKKAGGISIPLSRHSSFLNSNQTVDLDAISSHGISVREKILSGLDNYEMNTGMMHPFAVKRSDSESGLGTRASIPLTAFQNNMLWMGEITIGTPPQTFKVQIDTASADMWLLQTGCHGISGGHNLWDPDSSETSGKLSPFWLKYTDGTIVEGDRYVDILTIGGFTADPIIFNSATSYTSLREFPADGSLALAFDGASKWGAGLPMDSLVYQKSIINPTFSFKFSSPGAEMYVGGANSMLYNGDIAYTPVTYAAFWQVSMDDVRVNGNRILENVPAIFDTGSVYIFGDWERVSELYKRLGGTLEELGGFGYYYLPCDSFPTVSFTFGGKTFEIRPELLKLEPIEGGSRDCFSAIISQRAPVAFWTIGMTFLQGVYSVFDYSAKQVGFAKLA